MRGTTFASVMTLAIVMGTAARAHAQECKTLDGHRREIDLPAGWTSSRSALYAEGDELVRDDGSARALIRPWEAGACANFVLVDGATERPGTSARPNAYSARYSTFWVIDDGDIVRLAACLDVNGGIIGVQVNTDADRVGDPGLLALTEAIADAFQYDIRCPWEPEVATTAASAEADAPVAPGKPGPVISALDVISLRANYVSRGSLAGGVDVPDTATLALRATGIEKIFAYAVGLEGGRGIEDGWAYELDLAGGLGYAAPRWSAAVLVGSGYEGVSGSMTLGNAAPILVGVVGGVKISDKVHVAATVEVGWLPFDGKGDFPVRPPAAELGFADQGRVELELHVRHVMLAVSLVDHGGATGAGISIGGAMDPNIYIGPGARPLPP
jgi:hypothetical protein